MDIRCPNCREPWDNDELHYEAEATGSTYAELSKRFRREGCGAVFGNSACQAGRRDTVIGGVYDLMGDDMDGAMSMLEDAEMMGLL